jgi:hypothetical protein
VILPNQPHSILKQLVLMPGTLATGKPFASYSIGFSEQIFARLLFTPWYYTQSGLTQPLLFERDYRRFFLYLNKLFRCEISLE